MHKIQCRFQFVSVQLYIKKYGMKSKCEYKLWSCGIMCKLAFLEYKNMKYRWKIHVPINYESFLETLTMYININQAIFRLCTAHSLLNRINTKSLKTNYSNSCRIIDSRYLAAIVSKRQINNNGNYIII